MTSSLDWTLLIQEDTLSGWYPLFYSITFCISVSIYFLLAFKNNDFVQSIQYKIIIGKTYDIS